jgi:hypothetical protein
MSDKKKMHRLVHLDEKILKPEDFQGTGSSSASTGSKIAFSDIPSRDFLQKSIIGKPKVYDLQGNLLADETNLVVLIGREYLAQLLAGKQGDNPNDYTEYLVRYFGVGDGGTNNNCPPDTIGPYDDDLDLNHRVVIMDPSLAGPPNYIDGGKLKRIEQLDDQGNITEGEITIKLEEHTINTNTGGQQVVYRYTAVRYTMYIQPEETPKPNGFFKFNEAGLYAVKHVNGQPTDDYILFARFTTLDKYLETNDGIMIEWYVLV